MCLNDEIEVVKKTCKFLNCNFIKLNWNEKPDTAIMEKARIARYTEISKSCKKFNIKTLFLGHHSDDIAESVAMRILSKSDLEGLCPMFELRELFNIKLFRPFLKISKRDILQYNSINNINYINDVSNQNIKFSRVRIRKLLGQDQYLKNKRPTCNINWG